MEIKKVKPYTQFEKNKFSKTDQLDECSSISENTFLN